MRRACFRSLRLAAALVAVLTFAAQSMESDQMAEMTLTLETAHASLIAGEAPMLVVRLQNGAAARDVPSPDSVLPLRLRVTDLQNGAARNHLPGDARRQRRPDKPRRRPDLVTEPSPAGAETVYEISLDSFMRGQLPPGRWRFEARLAWGDASVVSPPLELEVLPFAPRVMFGLNNLSKRALRQVALQDAAGGAVLLVHESATGHPADNGFQRVLEGLPADAQIAMAAPTRAVMHGLYAAALTDGVLIIGAAMQGELFRVDTGMPDAALHPFGWQTEHGAMEFMLVGSASSGGAPDALIVHADLRTGTTEIRRIPLPLDALSAPWQVRRDAHRPFYRMVFAASGSLQQIDISPEGATAARKLTRAQGPLRAIGFHPVGAAPQSAVDALPSGRSNYASGAPEDVIDAVFGPFDRDGRAHLTFLRVAAATGVSVTERSFAAPATPERGVQEWAVSITTGEPPLIAVVLGDKLYGLGPTGPVRELADKMTDAEHLNLHWFGASYVLTWASRDGVPMVKVVN
jgi:hypothetical protein